MRQMPETFNENEIRAAFNEAQTVLKMPEAIVFRLVEKFISSTADSIEKLLKAVEAGDFEEIRMTAHNIKGSAATLRFDAMSRVALGIEAHAKEEQAADYLGDIDTLAQYLGRIDAYYQANRP